MSWAQGYNLAFSTYLGGSELDQLCEVIVGRDGIILLGGQSHSEDYPVTEGVVQNRYASEPARRGHPGVVGGDMVLTRLSNDGRQIVSSTYFGGSKQERSVYAMYVDRQGNIVFGSATRSPGFRTTKNAFQTADRGSRDGFVIKLTGKTP